MTPRPFRIYFSNVPPGAAAPTLCAMTSASPPRLRLAHPGDLGNLVELERRAFPDPWSLAMLEAELQRRDAFQLLAFPPEPEGAAPVGYAAFRLLGPEAELLRLAVIPEARRRGHARALVELGLRHLSWEGVESCFLEVRERNLPALRLYEVLGFEAVGRRRAYYRDGTDALLYARPVAAR